MSLLKEIEMTGIDLNHLKEITKPSSSKIIFLIIDGLGGLPYPGVGKTELEAAKTPNLDSLAEQSICGLMEPIGPGITPGSGVAHLALFGYDPFQFSIGRGVLEAMGIDFEIARQDIAARGNFCTVDGEGIVIDRRAGRISTEQNAGLCQKLSQIKIAGAELFILPVKEHRFALILRGDGLNAEITDSDPQQTGVGPKSIIPLSAEAERTAIVVNELVKKAKTILSEDYPANMILLRGFSRLPSFPSMAEVYHLNPAAIAGYPMYRGLAKLLGMTVLESGSTIEEEFDALARHYPDYDFFYLHIKETDSAGEDGDFWRKVKVIEEVDALLPRLLALHPEVIVVTGDHSTPALLKGHSWHPVPFLLYSPWCRSDDVVEFSERACQRGSLGKFPALEAMPLTMANALKMNKFGA
jgi:2,3-bisphosphoglycerate-independent phosphoglycerate mutase